MSRALREALDRTLLLMRDELVAQISDEALITALTETEIVLVGDECNLGSHAAQCAYVSAALLMARSGHRVYLAAPDVRLIGRQPPLEAGTLVTSLQEVGRDLMPGMEFSIGTPTHAVDLSISFGNSRQDCTARRTISVNASAWSAFVESAGPGTRWQELPWPLGSLAAAALAAGEAFKVSMFKLRRFARVPDRFDELFAFSDNVRFDLASPGASTAATLGRFDFVSGGAITNAALFCLARIPNVTGLARIIENDLSDLTNLNRFALLRRSQVSVPKVDTLRGMDFGALVLRTVLARYDEATAANISALSPYVLIGVDHIPTRWAVQRANPQWLGIGATTHWSAMASFHEPGLPCAGCLHPIDDSTDAPIPTVAFVSFWSGLLLASYFVRMVSGERLSPREQHAYFTPLRSNSIWWSPIAFRRDCPVWLHDSSSCCAAGGHRP